MTTSSPSLRTVLRALAGAACVLAPVLMVAGIHSPLRVAAALALFALAPGVALLGLLAPRAPAEELALVVATSLAAGTLLTQIMLWLGLWSPTGATCLVGVLSLAAIALAEVRERLA